MNNIYTNKLGLLTYDLQQRVFGSDLTLPVGRGARVASGVLS